MEWHTPVAAVVGCVLLNGAMDLASPVYGYLLLALVLSCLALSWLLASLLLDAPAPPLSPAQVECESHFTDERGKRRKFPSLLAEEASIALSVVVPSYNERERLPGMLEESIAFLSARANQEPSLTWEIVVVDDGSKDHVHEVVLPLVKQHGSDAVRLMTLAVNQGKGGAVQMGVLAARGRYIYMADADSAALMSEIVKLEQGMLGLQAGGLGIAIGSRAHLQEASVAKRKWYRTILMHGFHGLVKWVGGVHGIQDTQCGYKLFSRAAATEVFSRVHVRRWAFDVEVLRLAQVLRVPIKEVSIVWHDADGSKMTLTGMLNMARDLFRIRYMYSTGRWSTPEPLV